MSKTTLLCSFLLSVSLLIGCGGGGGSDSGVGAVLSASDQLLASQIIGVWKLDQETKDGKLVPVKPNSSGVTSIMTFNANNTASSIRYPRTTSYVVSPIDPLDPKPVADTDFYQTLDGTPAKNSASWAVSNGSIITTIPSGETSTNKVEIRDGKLYQIDPDGEIYVWVK